MRVWEYELTHCNYIQKICMPGGSEILAVQMCKGILSLWVLVEDKATYSEMRHIVIYGTGKRMRQCNHKYIGNYQIESDKQVFHVFERR